MKRRSRYTLLFSILCLSTNITVLSQAPINILSVQQGLPRSQIYDIVQDSSGFIWLGTRDGLVKYDGFSCETYRAGNGGMPFNYIYHLFIDSKDRLWFASNADYSGAAYLDLSTKTFTHVNTVKYPTLSNDGIVAITEDSRNQIVLITKNFELNVLDEKTGTFKSYKLSDYLPDKRPVVNIGDIISDPLLPGVIWISALEGVFRFNYEEEVFTDLLYEDGWTPTNFLPLQKGNEFLWLGLADKGGLLRIDLQAPFDKMFYGIDTSFHVSATLNTRSQPSFSISDMAKKSDQELFIATANRGLITFNLTTNRFDLDQHKSKILDSDFIRSSYSNAQGELWAGADIAGLFYLRPQSTHLKAHFFPSQNEIHSEFRMSDILALDDSMYLMTFFRYPEVWLWNRNDNSYEGFPFDNETHYGDNIIKYDERILIGCSRNGIFEFKPDRKQVINRALDLPPNSTNINKMIADSSGLWYVNWGIGLSHYKDSLVQIIGGDSDTGLRHTWTHDIAFGPTGSLWVGQENGLYSIDKKTHKILTHASRGDLRQFDNPNFKALEFDQNNRLWVGNFGTGLSCYDIYTHEILGKIKVAEGLPSDRVYDIIMDDDGFLWVWTSDGLCSFYPENNLSEINLTYYPESKFLPVDRLGIWFTKIVTGEIFFGVAGGFVHFDPSNLRQDHADFLDPPSVTDFKIFNESVPLGLQDLRKEFINLKPNQNFFSFSFSAPKSGFLSRQQFNYQLEGVDKEWVNSENRRIATYTNIAPGTYKFRTRVGNQNGLWSDSSAPLIVIVATPWYATTMARFLWVLLALSIVYAINRVFIIRERMTAQLKMQQIEAQNLRNLDEAKSTFFTQISHEFRTPLTVILGMADLLKAQIVGKSNEMVFAIERNGKQLLKQINQILDLSKLQSKSVQLELIQRDIIAYIRYLTQSFVTYAESKRIHLGFSTTSDQMIMDYDPERIKDVLSNLISNALKFTPANGEISVKARKLTEKDPYFLELLISDTGAGISEDDITHIFEPYYQGKTRNKSLGTGLGLATTRQWINAMGGQIQVQSVWGKGSTFSILLPITNSANADASLSTNDLQHEPLVEGWEITGTDQHLERSSILLIEDHLDVVNYIRLCLPDFEIVHASDGEQGIKRAIEDVPDLIITDIMMPVKDGYEVCAILRSNDATSHIPIIMLTAKATQEEKRMGLSLGADAYLTKPFDQKELNIRVNGLLSQRRLLQEKYSQRFEAPEILISDTEDQFLDQIQHFVVSHLDRDFSVEDLATHLNMSRVQLYRKVKALTGKSVSVYIRLIRLYKARKLLLSTQKNVTEVAYETGFSDPSYFSRVFKEEFSLNPSEVRKS